jgi:hypothetical protein
MSARRIVACAVVILSVLAVASMGANAMTWNRTTHFTFNAPVRLPGVVLLPGSYTFELGSQNDLSVVRVLDRSRSKVYFTAFTHLVTRPDDNRRDAIITFHEVASGAPRAIHAWYPQSELTGRQFIY